MGAVPIYLLGVAVKNEDAVMNYLKEYVLKKEVFLKFDNRALIEKESVEAYVFLKNKIFINSYLIKSGMAKADRTKHYEYKTKFIEMETVEL